MGFLGRGSARGGGQGSSPCTELALPLLLLLLLRTCHKRTLFLKSRQSPGEP